MSGNLPRAPSRMRVQATRPRARRAGPLFLASLAIAVCAGAAEPRPPGSELPSAAVLANLGEVRRLVVCDAVPLEDAGQALTFRGRPALEIKGRERGGAADGTIRDVAVVDVKTARIVSYSCFLNASTRKAGEAIISLSEISTIADARVRALLPGLDLFLESIQRYRMNEVESVYYEARYADPAGEIPFFEPPVRLLLNASTGTLFRLNFDADWLDPVALPRLRITRQSAERIARVVLAGRDLGGAFGAGTALGKVGAAELFMVHQNGWLGFNTDDPDARARLAFVVTFRLEGGEAPGAHSIFIDAATGRVIGGFSGTSSGHQPR